MRTILKRENCILNHEYRPIEKCKNGEEIMHQNKVESIIIFKDKYDYNGVYTSTEKIFIDFHFLSEIREAIEEIEKDRKIMKVANEFPF